MPSEIFRRHGFINIYAFLLSALKSYPKLPKIKPLYSNLEKIFYQHKIMRIVAGKGGGR